MKQENNLKFWKYATLISSVFFIISLYIKPKEIEKIVYKEKEVQKQEEQKLQTVKTYDKNGILRKEVTKSQTKKEEKQKEISLEKQLFKEDYINSIHLKYGVTSDRETQTALFYDRKIMGRDNLYLSGEIGLKKLDKLDKTNYSAEGSLVLNYKW